MCIIVFNPICIQHSVHSPLSAFCGGASGLITISHTSLAEHQLFLTPQHISQYEANGCVDLGGWEMYEMTQIGGSVYNEDLPAPHKGALGWDENDWDTLERADLPQHSQARWTCLLAFSKDSKSISLYVLWTQPTHSIRRQGLTTGVSQCII